MFLSIVSISGQFICVRHVQAEDESQLCGYEIYSLTEPLKLKTGITFLESDIGPAVLLCGAPECGGVCCP